MKLDSLIGIAVLIALAVMVFTQSKQGTCYVDNQPVKVKNVDNCL